MNQWTIKENVPVITILLAPIAFATNKDNRPIGPAPKIRTFEPMPMFARLQACTPTDNGSNSAPSANVTLSGNLQRFCYKYYSLHLQTKSAQSKNIVQIKSIQSKISTVKKSIGTPIVFLQYLQVIR